MENISFNNRNYKVVEVKELGSNVSQYSDCNVQIIARGVRGAWKLFFMNTNTGKIVEVM